MRTFERTKNTAPTLRVTMKKARVKFKLKRKCCNKLALSLLGTSTLPMGVGLGNTLYPDDICRDDRAAKVGFIFSMEINPKKAI